MVEIFRSDRLYIVNLPEKKVIFFLTLLEFIVLYCYIYFKSEKFYFNYSGWKTARRKKKFSVRLNIYITYQFGMCQWKKVAFLKKLRVLILQKSKQLFQFLILSSFFSLFSTKWNKADKLQQTSPENLKNSKKGNVLRKKSTTNFSPKKITKWKIGDK